MSLKILGLTALAAVCALTSAKAALAAPDVVLKGRLTGATHQTYIDLPFLVPEGVNRISVRFHYTGREQKSTIDLGLNDPNGFRGWSGGNKSEFTLSATDATPSYLPGPIIAGTWNLVMGVPNMRPAATSEYEAAITFGHVNDKAAVSAFTDKPLNDKAGWYRGDFHSHSAHSDGNCLSLGGRTVPCPVFLTLQAAKARGLDFIALSDHNSTSQYDAERELQPYFDTLLLIPAREITTFHGHANIFGTTEFVPFRLGTKDLPDVKTLAGIVHTKGALISINHPMAPTGEACMGCGWDAPTDYTDIDAVEVVNGGSVFAQHDVEGPTDGIPFWQARLNEGYHLTAIGGSDNHDAPDTPDHRSPVGLPTTVIYAENLSQADLLHGLKKGRVFVDMGVGADRILDLKASVEGRGEKKMAVMGETLAVRAKSNVLVEVEIKGEAGSHAELIFNGKALPQVLSVESEQATVSFHVTPKGPGAQWVRVNIHDQDGNIKMISNPIYFNIYKK
ncbi:CehA/McbA family metallohydrolase [Asticcacaulis sp. 201]|uniref:CehA/McbA family metallohydrolase n=1 Tax=Asticcacaulis sp. 201 TaxID=3028787 RepID=UPI0029161186|nr:CehA/McbA family metallohydrolase [Asticcacaulis sp. 201]MDV6330699.1 CehA/McbA family metallohydrolase [Asticcacaulis sp. 201]